MVLCDSHSSKVVPKNCSLTKGLSPTIVRCQLTLQVDRPGQIVKPVRVLGQEKMGKNKQKESQAVE